MGHDEHGIPSVVSMRPHRDAAGLGAAMQPLQTLWGDAPVTLARSACSSRPLPATPTGGQTGSVSLMTTDGYH
jgi:hypothetical protein